jgi:hypothetical protein
VNWCAAYLKPLSGPLFLEESSGPFIIVTGFDSNPDAPNASQGIIQAVGVFAIGVSGPGTYSTGRPESMAGVFTTAHLGVVSIWSAGTHQSDSGTLTINTLTATGASGTFSFVAVADLTTAATGTKTVTNGAFNVRF